MKSYPPELIDALTFETASRDGIKHANLVKSLTANKPIRQTLALREEGDGHKGKPQFASDTVAKLYEMLNPLSMDLPVHSRTDLLEAWDNQTFTLDVIRLANHFGPQIWRDAMNERDSSHGSQLLVRGEESYCTIDLFWELSNHREFIILQMEHLLFAKAMTYYRNHHSFRVDPPIKTQIVKLRMSDNIEKARKLLLMATTPVVTPKRKRPTVQNIYLQASDVPSKTKRGRITSVSSDGDDEKDNNIGSGRRRSQRGTLEANLNSIALDDLAQSRGSIGPSSGRTVAPARVQTQMTTGGSLASSSFAKPNNTNSNDNISDRNPTQATGTSPLMLSLFPTQANSAQPQPDAPTVAFPTNHDRSSMELGAPSTPGSNPELSQLRRTLAREIRKELYGGETKYYSEKLDEVFTRIWETDRETIQKDMGPEKYALVNEAVEHWLQWRQVAAKLVSITGIVPAANTPIPRHNYEEWVRKMGGEQQYLNILIILQEYQAALEDDNGIDLVVGRLMDALMATVKSPSAVRALESGLRKLCEQIRLWHSAVAGEEF
ncbi:hypothetical protein DM02DRAFT_623401 [Periconia macrospinosa]|uniref:Uncharacterized protein n=1 Tax=Periconia macrospinosa TaxID=97972 RepID=A0A2V1E6B3_9PLEO|nr:hypothetical protein DM02DRAFT_623401 [Periconia macrospinosa]